MIPPTNRRLLLCELAATIALAFPGDPEWEERSGDLFEEAVLAHLQIPGADADTAQDAVWDVVERIKRRLADHSRALLVHTLVRMGEMTDYEARALERAS